MFYGNKFLIPRVWKMSYCVTVNRALNGEKLRKRNEILCFLVRTIFDWIIPFVLCMH